MPCRKCGYHISFHKIIPIPSSKPIHAVITRPGPRPKPSYRCKALALLRELEDGGWHPVADLRRRGITGRWEPKTFTWQAELEVKGLIGYDRIPTRAKGYCLRIMPDKMQDAKKLMAELEDVEDGKNQRW